MSKLKIIFMGTPDFAATALQALLDSSHEIVAVYTQKARKAGRGMRERKSPVQVLAESHDLPVVTPRNFKETAELIKFAGFEADLAVVAAYGLILPANLLNSPRLGCINIHASLLPRWRGAAPIQRAIMAGDKETGITIMQMDEGLDTGGMLAARSLPIGPDATAGQIHDQLAALGGELIVDVLGAMLANGIQAVPQAEDQASYADKISKQETRIDWSAPAGIVHNFIRGLSPFPGAWFEFERAGRKERIKVLASITADAHGPAGTVLDDQLMIACQTGAVRLVQVQRAGKRPQPADIFLRGTPVPAGAVIG